MKHLNIVLTLLACFASAVQVQAQHLRTHESVLSYSFDKAFIYVTSEFASDTASRFIPEYIKPPYKERTILVYGPSLNVKMIMARDAGNFALLYKRGVTSISGNLRDTTARMKPLFDINFLQVRTEQNGKVLSDWQDLREVRNSQSLQSGDNDPDLTIFSDTLNVGEQLKVSFRNTALADTLINFFFQRQTEPLEPYMPMWKHDTAEATTHAMFMRAQLQQEKGLIDTLTSFYSYWPNKYSGKLKNEHFFVTSKVAMYFRKPSAEYPDNALEYAILTGNAKDTTWTITGHLLILPQLDRGKNYRLLVRYRANPGSVQLHTFYTDPAWYQTSLFYLLLFVLFVMLTLIFFLFRNKVYLRREKKKSYALKSNLQSIRAQLNPHFIFNALSSIQSLINDRKIDAANHYLSTFSDLLRHALNNSDKELIPLDQELKIITTYLSLEQLRFPFTYIIEVDERIDKAAIEFPSLLLQPLIENAIRHAVGPLAEKGKLQINFAIREHDLHVSIIDNGTGFGPKQVYQKSHGLRLTTERIRSLNQLVYPRRIDCEVKSTEIGTAVHLKFINWLQV